MRAILIVAGRVLASPLVNVFQKKLTNKELSPEFIVMMSYLFFVLLSIPILIIKQPFYFPAEFWIYIVLLGVFDIFGNMFLVKSLKTIDLSVFGPLNSFKPVFALIFSAFLLNETPSLAGAVGVLIIVFGSYFLGYAPKKLRVAKSKFKISRGLAFRMLAILLTSIAAVFSKKTILLSSPLITFVYWSVIGLPISVFIFLRSGSGAGAEFKLARAHTWKFLGLFSVFLLLQIFTLLAFERIFVGYSLALFQLSGLISVLFGLHFFKEKNVRYRLIGATIMCGGAMLIALFG
jgi:drug/metabolite transporter (DMT)-like permease